MLTDPTTLNSFLVHGIIGILLALSIVLAGKLMRPVAARLRVALRTRRYIAPSTPHP